MTRSIGDDIAATAGVYAFPAVTAHALSPNDLYVPRSFSQWFVLWSQPTLFYPMTCTGPLPVVMCHPSQWRLPPLSTCATCWRLASTTLHLCLLLCHPLEAVLTQMRRLFSHHPPAVPSNSCCWSLCGLHKLLLVPAWDQQPNTRSWPLCGLTRRPVNPRHPGTT